MAIIEKVFCKIVLNLRLSVAAKNINNIGSPASRYLSNKPTTRNGNMHDANAVKEKIIVALLKLIRTSFKSLNASYAVADVKNIIAAELIMEIEVIINLMFFDSVGMFAVCAIYASNKVGAPRPVTFRILPDKGMRNPALVIFHLSNPAMIIEIEINIRGSNFRMDRYLIKMAEIDSGDKNNPKYINTI